MGPLTALCLAGPTGCGKTAIAVRLAGALGLEIVNADSRQVYADFPLITAQPGQAERGDVPHHLYGFLPAAEKISAGRYMEEALKKISRLAARGARALLVGGTGLYFQALLRGMASIPPVPEATGAAIWQRMLDLGPAAMHGELAKIDAACAARIHPNDRQRIARALEVFAATGRPLSWWQARSRPAPPCRGPLIFIDESLDWLLPRLEARIDDMLGRGAIREAERALARYGTRDLPAFEGIGIREAMDFLAGRVSLGQCRASWLARTRAYAKRQLTWFRARPEAIAMRAHDFSGILGLAEKALAAQSRSGGF